MNIRTASPEDHPALLTLWEQSVRATHAFLSEDDIQALIPVVRDQTLPALEVWLLSDEPGTAVGFMGLDNNKFEALFISPACFRKGYGKVLLEHARKLKGKLQVDVNEQNPKAVAFYLNNGFIVAGRSPTDSQGRPFPLLHLREGLAA
jgi:putative acetyltransferase